MRSLINPGHPKLTILRQCELLGLSRSTYYYEPAPETQENLELMKLIDALYTKRPFLGSRKMVTELAREHDLKVNRKRVQRLMRLMGIESVLPGPRTSTSAPHNAVYPYLLRNVEIQRVNQVWSSDITYIPVARGWVYLVAVMDWYSRMIVSWELSNSMELQFCLVALERALRAGKPEVFNTDQGAQFTSPRFVGVLEEEGVQVSMDGRGRYLDNIWIERFWRSLKYEEVYLNEYDSPMRAWRGIRDYIEYFNKERAHQSLGYLTPEQVFHRQLAAQVAT